MTFKHILPLFPLHIFAFPLYRYPNFPAYLELFCTVETFHRTLRTANFCPCWQNNVQFASETCQSQCRCQHRTIHHESIFSGLKIDSELWNTKATGRIQLNERSEQLLYFLTFAESQKCLLPQKKSSTATTNQCQSGGWWKLIFKELKARANKHLANRLVQWQRNKKEKTSWPLFMRIRPGS